MHEALPAVKSALRTLDIIELIVVHPDGMTLRDVSLALSIPKSSLSYLLATLADRDYLRRDGRRFLPGAGLKRLCAPASEPSLLQMIEPHLRRIRTQLNETASLMTRDGWDAVIQSTCAAEQALRYSIDVGERRPLHTLAGGKALLAALPNAELDRYFAQSDRRAQTDSTIVSEIALRAELKDVREAGMALAIEESTPGISSIGCVVFGRGDAAAAIGIAIPSVRFTPAIRAEAASLLQQIRAALPSAQNL